MHSNGTLPLDVPLDAPLAARCGYSLIAVFVISNNLKESVSVLM